MMYSRTSCGELQRRARVFKTLHEVAEVGARELPLEGPGRLLVMALEGQNAIGQGVDGREIVGGGDLAVEDQEVDLVLVEPTGRDGWVYEPGVVPAVVKPLDARLPSMRRAVVDDP